jgi:AraC-like DNA-binding protein
MRYDFNFYSSILLIFFVHGLVYAALLFRKGIINENVSDKWLAAFLLLCSFYIAPWMLGFAGWYDHQPLRDIMFYVPMQLLFFIGPVIFFYVQSLLNPSFKFGKKEWLHLLPGILYLLFCLVMVVTDKIVLYGKDCYFLASGQDPEFDAWYQYTGFVSMLIYFLLSLKYHYLYKKLMGQVISFANNFLFEWVRNFLYAFLIMLLIKLVFYVGSFIPAFKKLDYVGPWWEYFSFAIVFYYIAITGYANAVQTKVSFKLNLLTNKPTLLLAESATKTAEDNFIEDADIIEIVNEQVAKKEDEGLLAEWKPKILSLLQNEKIYEDSELSLTQMAKQLKTNPSVLSKTINQGFQLNFNDFINNYRIEAVKEKLQAGEQKTQTLLGIAYDCGFNSKATFNRAFKKVTGTSPKEWLEIQA